MKFDRTSPRAWLWFLITAVNIAIATAVTLVVRRLQPSSAPRIALSGHHFNGNLRAFYESERLGNDWDIRYVYIDYSAYRRRRSETPGAALSSLRLDHAIWLAGADVLMTDHGPGIWRLLQLLVPRIQFVEVWHGVGFKALDRTISDQLAGYAAVFAASEWDAQETFVTAAGVDRHAVRVTGYARTDPLVLVSRNDVTTVTPTVLMAPTWSHGHRAWTGLPFGLDDRDYLEALDRWALDRRATVVMRTHINTAATDPGDLDAVQFRPSAKYPMTNELLAQATVLVTDWSSIAIDYLTLERPMIFLDVPAPFRRYRLEPDDRPGPLARSFDNLLELLDAALCDPTGAMRPFAEVRQRAIEQAFGDTLDGRSAARYAAQIESLIEARRGGRK